MVSSFMHQVKRWMDVESVVCICGRYPNQMQFGRLDLHRLPWWQNHTYLLRIPRDDLLVLWLDGRYPPKIRSIPYAIAAYCLH